MPVASRAGRARKVFCRQLAAPASGQGTTCPTGRQAAALGPHPLHRAAAPQARSLRARARATPGAPAPEGGRNPPGDRRPPPPRPAAERAVRRARSAPDAPPPRPSRDPARRGPAGKFPSLARPRRVTPGGSYRERAPAARAAESEVQPVLLARWPWSTAALAKARGGGRGRGRGTRLKGGHVVLKGPAPRRPGLNRWKASGAPAYFGPGRTPSARGPNAVTMGTRRALRLAGKG